MHLSCVVVDVVAVVDGVGVGAGFSSVWVFFLHRIVDVVKVLGSEGFNYAQNRTVDFVGCACVYLCCAENVLILCVHIA